MDCLEKLVEYLEKFSKGKIDADTSFKIERQILTDEIDDQEFLNFAIENFSELFSYIASGRVNIRILRDIEGPPKDASGKPARWFVWRVRCGLGCAVRHTKSCDLQRSPW